MPLYGTLASLSQTAASNAADGAVDAPSTIDQQTNLLASFIAQLRDGVGTNYSLGPRNLLINANGAINQRGYATGAATSGANQYTLDRWRVVTSGQSVAFGAASPDRTMTAPAGGLEQVIEGASVIGGVYTLSWTGTATATVNGAAITNGGNTASLPANTNVTVRFIGGTVTLPQFELGTVATPFERRTYSVELAMCQRYYELCGMAFRTYSGGAAGQRYVTHYGFKATKRVTPTLTAIGSISVNNVTSDSVAVATGAPLEGIQYEVIATGANTDTFIFNRVIIASAEL